MYIAEIVITGMFGLTMGFVMGWLVRSGIAASERRSQAGGSR